MASEVLRSDFDSAEADAFAVVATGGVTDEGITPFAAEVSAVEGVARADAADGRYAGGAGRAGRPDPGPILDRGVGER